MKKYLLTLLTLLATLGSAFAAVSEYSSNAYKYIPDGTEYTISIPTLNGAQVANIKAVVVAAPGIGGNRSFKVSDKWAKFLYENGLAYIGIGSSGSSPATTIECLNHWAAADLGGMVYGELANAPFMAYGESAGGSTAASFAFDHPERTIAFVVEHTRFFFELADATDAGATKAVPGYYRWGEWDSGRYNEGFYSRGASSILPMIQQGAQWMCVLEDRQTHGTRVYDFEEAMGYFGLIMDARYDYQEGTPGKDPALGAVTLTTIAPSSGYLGEHIIGDIQTVYDANGEPYANLIKDWESADPYYAPYDNFERSDKNNHSWMPNADVAAFWATKFSHGKHDLNVKYIDIISDDLGDDAVASLSSVFPNYFIAGQDIRVEVDASAFANTERVEFYANSTLMGTDSSAPYSFNYNFTEGQTGMQAIYPVAVASDGSRTVGFRRMVQVYSKIRGANTAPTVSPIGFVADTPGATLSVPFTVGDAESTADSLSVSFEYVNRTSSIDSNDYAFSFSGSGAERTLNITMPTTAGIIWGIVQVSDGDMSTNAYVTIQSTGDGTEAPFFVDGEAVVSTPAMFTHGAWSRRISVPVYDYDTDVANLTLTASADNPSNIPDENILTGGSGRFRYVQIKPNGSANVTLSLSDGNTTVTKSFWVGLDAQDNFAPIISNIPNQTASYSNQSDPIEVRLYDLHTSSQKLTPTDTPLSLSVTSGNQSLIPNGNISVTQKGARRLITYTPAYNQTGTVTLTATVTDEGALTATDTFDVTVSAPPTLSATGGSLDTANASRSYSYQLNASGGIQPYSWTLVSGSLPNGLALGANGLISGTPSETGTFQFDVAATDSDPFTPATDTVACTLIVHSYVPAPFDLAANAETDSSVTLTWTDTAVSETGYEIERRAQGQFTWTSLASTAADATSYNDNNSLVAGTFYEYRIRAVGTIEGDYTEWVTAEALGAPTITIQPQDTAVLPGNTAILSVEVTGGDLSYQWYEGSSGDESNALFGATNATLSVENITASRTFWVRVTNPVSSADSDAATTSVEMAAPSLKVNLGADAGTGWNSYASYAAFNGNTTLTDSNLIYTSGNAADGVSLTITRTDANEPFYDHFNSIPLPGYTSDWLNDTAATSAWGIGLGYDMKYEVSGLPAGTYQIEAYVYLTSTTASANDGSTYPAYKLDTNRLLAGISGATATTSAEYDSSTFDADAHPTQVLRWAEVQVASGETVEIFSTSSAATQEYPVLNAFIIQGLELDLPRPSLTSQPQSSSVNEGESTSLTVAATTSGGPLSYQWYQGVSGDTSTPVGTDSSSLTTPALSETTGYWVRVSDDNGTRDSDTAVVTVQQAGTAERILFIGNSFTNGYVAPAQTYNAANVTDLNGTGYGGVPGIFAKIASDSGYPVDVGIESVNGSTLLGRYPGKVDLVTNPAWDRYVLQARSQEAMQDGRTDGSVTGSASAFNSTVGDWKTAILNANPQAAIWLYAPWASPTYVGEGEYYTEAEGVATFLNEINTTYENGFTTLGLDGWVPVGQAFADAADNGLTDLYHIDDHHANAAGSYLAAVMMYRHLLGGDSRLLPTGPGSASSELGLTDFQADTIHRLAYDFVYPSSQPLPPSITQQPADTSILSGETATLTVDALGDSLSYQWYEGTSGDIDSPVGTNASSFTTPALTTNTSYWIAVSNVNGTTNSATATVTVSVPDTTAPADVADLSSSAQSSSSVTLTWTAPGDDSTTGTATSYDIRYSTSQISNDTDFSNATEVTGEPSPSAAGMSESFAVAGLSAETTYYFAIKTSDEQGNTSALSNVHAVATSAQSTSWTAYHDTEGGSTGNVSNGNADGISYNIVNYDDGTDTGVDLTVSYDLGTWSLNQQRNAAAQIPSTGDANALFSGYILDDGLISFSAGSGDPVATITFSHLQAGTSYDVALLMNRSYDAGETQYQLQGISSSDNISSTGAHIIDSATTGLNAFNGGNGYVARWENIIPSGSTFSIVVSEVDAAQYIFLPQAIRIVATAAPPTITFTSWADGFSVTASENDDSDGDGISNLLEYALDLDPTAQDSSSLPSVETENDSGTDYLTLRYRRNLNAPDLTYTIVSSTDLSTWHAATVESDTVDTADPDGDGSSEIRKARVAFSEAENGKLFLRLKVETR